jgi:hypothetical protein
MIGLTGRGGHSAEFALAGPAKSSAGLKFARDARSGAYRVGVVVLAEVGPPAAIGGVIMTRIAI